MPKVAYKPGDLDADVAKAAGPLQVMTYPKGMKFAIEVDLPKEVESDKLLAQELWLGVGAIYRDLVSRIAENLKNTDRGAVQLRNNREVEKLKKLIEVVNRGIQGAVKVVVVSDDSLGPGSGSSRGVRTSFRRRRNAGRANGGIAQESQHSRFGFRRHRAIAARSRRLRSQ